MEFLQRLRLMSITSKKKLSEIRPRSLPATSRHCSLSPSSPLLFPFPFSHSARFTHAQFARPLIVSSQLAFYHASEFIVSSPLVLVLRSTGFSHALVLSECTGLGLQDDLIFSVRQAYVLLIII